MKPARRWNWLWMLATRIAARRPPRPTAEQIDRADWPADARRVGVRMSERIRDTWRGKWLRCSRDEGATEQVESTPAD